MEETKDEKLKTIKIKRFHGGYTLKPWYLDVPMVVLSLDDVLSAVRSAFTNSANGLEIEP